jgi:PAS domain S-box-containing protein
MLQEEPFFHLFELTPDLVCIVSKEGYFKKINPAVSHTLGYTNAELMARPVASFIHPEDRQRTAANRQRLLAGKPLLNFKNRYLTNNGSTVWLEWTSVYLPAKEMVFAIAKNITTGQLAEMALAEKVQTLSQLHTHVKQYTDKERRQIASALHEDLGQLASVIKTKMEWLTGQHSLSVPNSELLQQTLGATSQLLNKLRSLSYALGDGSLAIQGLNESLQVLCREFSAQTGLTCLYKSRFSERRLSEEEKLDIYRICQEALQNIAKHAAASEATVFLRQTKRGLLLTITDNGIGFAAGKEKVSGVSAMRARALSLQGLLNIQTGAGGTTVSLLLKTHSVAPAIRPVLQPKRLLA